eukprot:TRINITY_DN26748_c1_g2_i1.p1 TRINITY_DN26748_c1_g2~~TRINITY_DN26748_c1_g2_i1.p1  ORF type:complete len:202 (+),score=48.70 TRINITY_DN26748_c1_g2_i1:65-670(+)
MAGFLAAAPDGFSTPVPALNALPIDAVRRAASHTVRSHQRKRQPPSAADYSRRLGQAGTPVPVRQVRSVFNWLDYLYLEAARCQPEIQEFGKRVRRAARGIEPEKLEALWTVWEKDGAGEAGSGLQVVPRLVDMQWRLGVPIACADASRLQAKAPNVVVKLRTLNADGTTSEHGLDLPYAGFLQLVRELEKARDAVAREGS